MDRQRALRQSHEGFELREAEFNGIEVRTVGRQITSSVAPASAIAGLHAGLDFVGR